MALIYIVEDDKNISEIESFSLKNAGHETKEFADGKSFSREIMEKKPDLILLDVMLPDEDGLTILKKLRERRETRKIPVIMVTAKTTELDKVKGLDNGADDYMTKPFGVMELVSRVKALLRRVGDQDSEKIMRIGDLVIDDEKRKVFVEGNVINGYIMEHIDFMVLNTAFLFTFFVSFIFLLPAYKILNFHQLIDHFHKMISSAVQLLIFLPVRLVPVLF